MPEELEVVREWGMTSAEVSVCVQMRVRAGRDFVRHPLLVLLV